MSARALLAATQADPLGLLYRIVLPRGARRGEAAGLRCQRCDGAAGPDVRAVSGGGRESNPPTTRHAVHWF